MNKLHKMLALSTSVSCNCNLVIAPTHYSTGYCYFNKLFYQLIRFVKNNVSIVFDNCYKIQSLRNPKIFPGAIEEHFITTVNIILKLSLFIKYLNYYKII